MADKIDSIIDDFEFLDEWEDKYRFVIELGKTLDPLEEADRNDANKVNGCVSQVWVSTNVHDDAEKTITFVGDSDAHIVRGLVAIMITAMSGRPAQQIIDYDVEGLLAKLGLDSHLTPQRSNGLRAMVDRMKADAKSALST